MDAGEYAENATYQWVLQSDPDNTLSTEQTLTIDEPGAYTVTISDGDCEVEATKEVQGISQPEITGPGVICGAEKITLDAGEYAENATYQWVLQSAPDNTLSTEQTLTIDEPGAYTVTISDGDCEVEATKEVQGISQPEITGPPPL